MEQLDASLCLLHLHVDNQYAEGIPVSLIREVMRSLPYDADQRGWELKQRLNGWLESTTPVELLSADLKKLEEELNEFAHLNPSQLGRVGQLPHGSAGRIVGPDQRDGDAVASSAILALSVRRFIILAAMGVSYTLFPSAGLGE